MNDARKGKRAKNAMTEGMMPMAKESTTQTVKTERATKSEVAKRSGRLKATTWCSWKTVKAKASKKSSESERRTEVSAMTGVRFGLCRLGKYFEVERDEPRADPQCTGVWHQESDEGSWMGGGVSSADVGAPGGSRSGNRSLCHFGDASRHRQTHRQPELVTDELIACASTRRRRLQNLHQKLVLCFFNTELFLLWGSAFCPRASAPNLAELSGCSREEHVQFLKF